MNHTDQELSHLKAQMDCLNYVVAFLAAATLPLESVSRLAEALETPVDTGGPLTTEAMHKANERFIDVLCKHAGLNNPEQNLE